MVLRRFPQHQAETETNSEPRLPSIKRFGRLAWTAVGRVNHLDALALLLNNGFGVETNLLLLFRRSS